MQTSTRQHILVITYFYHSKHWTVTCQYGTNLMANHIYHSTHLSRGFIGEPAAKPNASPNLMANHIYHSTHLSRGFIGEPAVQPHASLNSFILDRGLITRSRDGLCTSTLKSSPAWHHSCTQNTQ
jgi:hypothetical protein